MLGVISKRPFPFIILVAWVFSNAGCVSAPVQPPPPRSVVLQKDNQLEKILSKDFDAKVRLKKDGTISAYLKKLSHKLISQDPDFKDSRANVFLIDDVNGKWKNVGLPGFRLYLNIHMLQLLEYESEVAALLAFELGHLAHRHLVAHFRNVLPKTHDAPPDPTGRDPRGLSSSYILTESQIAEKVGQFDLQKMIEFDLEENLVAIEKAVSILYSAGYDPRGLLSVWEHLQKKTSHSAYSEMDLQTFVRKTHRFIAQQVPLLNPIVRSDEFLVIRKRIQDL